MLGSLKEKDLIAKKNQHFKKKLFKVYYILSIIIMFGFLWRFSEYSKYLTGFQVPFIHTQSYWWW